VCPITTWHFFLIFSSATTQSRRLASGSAAGIAHARSYPRIWAIAREASDERRRMVGSESARHREPSACERGPCTAQKMLPATNLCAEISCEKCQVVWDDRRRGRLKAEQAMLYVCAGGEGGEGSARLRGILRTAGRARCFIDNTTAWKRAPHTACRRRRHHCIGSRMNGGGERRRRRGPPAR
jgi:hypothetical protein